MATKTKNNKLTDSSVPRKVKNPRVPPAGKSFADRNPQLLSEWSKNNSLKPEEVFASSAVKIEWICSKKDYHVWIASPEKRTKGRGCPFCAGRRVHPQDSLANTHPEIVAEWDYEKNEKTPEEISSMNSDSSYFWKCKTCKHNWKTNIKRRVKYANSKVTSGKCPQCFPQQRSGLSVIEVCPVLTHFWNDKKDPSNFSYQSHKVVKWKCPQKGHKWEESIKTITKRLEHNICKECKKLSMKLSSELLKEWHSIKNKNIEISSAKTMDKVWWKCAKGHEWEAVIYRRAVDGTGCPYCAGKKVSADNSLAFLNPSLSAEWDFSKNKFGPDECRPGTHKKVWWICKKDSRHKWKAAVLDRNNGDGCPACANKKLIPESNSFAAVHPTFVKFWSSRNKKEPTEVLASSKTKYWFNCKSSDHKEFHWRMSTREISKSALRCPGCTGYWSSETFKSFLNYVIQSGQYNQASLKELFEKFNIYKEDYRIESNIRFLAKLLLDYFPEEKELIKFLASKPSLIDKEIIKFQKQSSYRSPIPQKLRKEVIKRDKGICQNPYCPKQHTKIHIDHKTPWIFGGQHTLKNLHVLCSNCNARKSATRWEDFLKSEKEKSNIK